MPQKIIIDTDPGIDDAMAIFFAIASPDLEILGLTTTFGNVSVDQATTNALNLVEMVDNSIPVARGVSVPMVQAPLSFPDFVHGSDGFGNVNLPAPKGKAIDLSAAEFIVKTILENPHEVTLIAIGPLGNLAKALALEPGIAKLVKKVVIMGGTILETGNVSPVAEANIYGDPHAADIVFSADWRVHMIGLDVTHKVTMRDDLQARIRDKNPNYGQFLYDAGRFYADFYKASRSADGCFVHDASAVAYAINPDLFQAIDGPVRVATEGFAKGQTILKRAGYTYPENHWDVVTDSSVCMEVDEAALLSLYESTLTQQ
jgi:inosine-uridine nucleoside N-ribohydrolase